VRALSRFGARADPDAAAKVRAGWVLCAPVTSEISTDLRARRLDESTWSDFAQLVERHNGVWGGCWCMGFRPEGVGRTKTVAQNRAEKEARVREGRAHAALVYDGSRCVGWCQFGPPDELPRMRAIPRTPRAARCQGRFSTTRPCRCSRAVPT
jgi:hypothetical protein